MTLVCVTHRGPVPILLSDVLLSSPIAPGHAEIATFDHTNSLEFKGAYKISGTAAKIVIVRPCLAVAWAGDRMEAHSVIRHLSETLGEAPELGDLTAKLAAHFADDRANVALIGSLVYGTFATIFRWDGLTGEFSTGPMFIEGSGSESLADVLSPPDLIHLVATSYDNNPTMDALTWGLNCIGELIGREVLNGGNLPYFFGGGYDLVFFDGNCFRRIGDVTQVFLGVEVTNLSSPQQLGLTFTATTVWQSVVANTLIIERVDLAQSPVHFTPVKFKASIRKTRRSDIAFSKVDRGQKSPGGPNYLIVHIIFHVKGREFGRGFVVYLVPNTEISITRDRRFVRFEMSRQCVEDVSSQSLQMLKNPDVFKVVSSGFC